MNSDSKKNAVVLAFPSIAVIALYAVFLISAGGKILACVPLLFISIPVLAVALIAGIPAVRQSDYSPPKRFMLFACHIVAALFTLTPILILLVVLLVRGGLESA